MNNRAKKPNKNSPRDNLILLARVGTAHGIKGAVRVKSFTADPLSLRSYGALRDKEGKKYLIKNIKLQKNSLIVQFEGINNRDLAQALNGIELYIERKALPQNLGENEYYIVDLIGCDVLDNNNKLVGTIISVENFGAGDLLEIAPLNQDGGFSDKTYYLNFDKKNVPEVNLEEYYIIINPPKEFDEKNE